MDNCRGQGYDSGSNMAGAYEGVQARIREVNELASFVPCTAHSLNLVGKNAATRVLSAKLLLGQIQSTFNLFSAAPNRWSKLKEHVLRCVKSQSSTRWSAKAEAVTVSKTEFEGIVDEMQENIESDSFNAHTVADATSILNQILNMKFLVGIYAWDPILDKINRVNQSSQERSSDISRAQKLLKGLLGWIAQPQTNYYEKAWLGAAKIASEMRIPDN